MKNRIWSLLGLGVLVAMAVGSQAEARTNISLNFAGFFGAVSRPVARPVVVAPAPVYAVPCYEEVVVYPDRHHDYAYVRRYPCYRPAAVTYYEPAPYYYAPAYREERVGVSISKDYGSRRQGCY